MGRKAAPARGGRRQVNEEEFEDEIDKFHKQRDRINLDPDEDVDDSEDEEQQAVFNIQENNTSEEEEEESEDEEELTGLAAKLSKQEKFMRQKMGGAKEEDEEDEDGEEEDGGVWGKRKKTYYSADNVDFELQSDDEEAPAEEEKEVLKMQRKVAATLKPEDYEQEEDDEEDEEEDDEEDEEEDEEGEETMQDVVEKREKKGVVDGKKNKVEEERESSEMAVEEVVKDLNSLSKEQQMEAVMSDAPELVGLLSDLRESLDELKGKVQPLLEQVRSGQYSSTPEGVSYLESKHLLLLSYCSSIVFYLLMKSEGRSVRDHPVIGRLVELRMYLEKIRPIDKKLQYQMDKLLKAAASAAPGVADGEAPGVAPSEDALKFRPNPELLVSRVAEDTRDSGGAYKPPKLSSVAMEELEPRGRSGRGGKKGMESERAIGRRAARSAYVRQLADELEGRPEEVAGPAAGSSNESAEMRRERERLARRAQEEEELFARVPLSREERKKLRGLHKNTNSFGSLLEDFGDDVADIVRSEDSKAAPGPHSNGGDFGSLHDDGGLLDELLKRKKMSQVIAEAGKLMKKAKVLSGDADLPLRDDLGERRRAHDSKLMSKRQKEVVFDDEDEVDAGGEPEEDEVYAAAKETRNAKLASKAAMYTREGVVPQGEAEVEGKRGINRDIEKNRGLTPHRNKLVRNPRKKYKVAHAKAVVRRKGQVRDVQRELAPYAGQSTGIKANVSRSTRLNK